MSLVQVPGTPPGYSDPHWTPTGRCRQSAEDHDKLSVPNASFDCKRFPLALMCCRHPITQHITGRARARTCKAVCKARERFQARQNKHSDNFPRTNLFDVLREGRSAGCSPHGSLRGGQLGPSAAAGRLFEHGQPRRQRHATTSHHVNANHSRSLLALSRSLRTGGPACSQRLPRL